MFTIGTSVYCLFVSALGTSYLKSALNFFVEPLSICCVVSRKDRPFVCSCDIMKTKIQIGKKQTTKSQFYLLLKSHIQSVIRHTVTCRMCSSGLRHRVIRRVVHKYSAQTARFHYPQPSPSCLPVFALACCFCDATLSSVLEFHVHFLTAARYHGIDI